MTCFAHSVIYIRFVTNSTILLKLADYNSQYRQEKKKLSGFTDCKIVLLLKAKYIQN